MKVDITDIAWAAVSLGIVGYSYSHGRLIYGVIVIYLIMAALMFMHIGRIRKRFSRGIPVYGRITGYHETDKGEHVYPIVAYTTEEGRDVTSTYIVRDKKKRFELQSETMICYDPDDPVFFFFPDRQDDMTKYYMRFIVIGAVISLILLIVSQFI